MARQSTLLTQKRGAPYRVPSHTHLKDVLSILHQFNQAGVMVSWSFEDNDWVMWERPIRVSSRGKPMPVSARSFSRVPKFQPPSCPHFFPDRSSKMKLLFNQSYQGVRPTSSAQLWFLLSPRPHASLRPKRYKSSGQIRGRLAIEVDPAKN
ncbi:hypothetical protein B0H10DRAFT_1957513 [Mycena sp. CBHHK59/15]|nr:hypothetical protein B0H10DRAFT_1957513 [Mycena sp. CBHHK59/15]